MAYVVGCLGYLAICMVCLRTTQPLKLGRWWVWLLGCVLLRLVVLHTAPSDDVYRYEWEGKVQLAGFNPYTHAPDASLLASMRDDNWAKINHPDYPAIYPALAQLEFRLAAWLWPSVYTVKVFHVLWDMVTLGLLAYGLRLMGKPAHWSIVYGLSPLVLSAFAVEGHLDSLMLAFMMLAIVCAMREKFILAGVAVGLAISSKLIAAILLPWLIVRHWRGAVATVIVLAITYWPFASAGADLWASLARFSSGDEFFSLVGAFLPSLYATTWGRLCGMFVLGLVSLWAAFRYKTIPRYTCLLAGTLLLLMPIVHYWYLSWVLAFLPFGFACSGTCVDAPVANASDENPRGLKPAAQKREAQKMETRKTIDSVVGPTATNATLICWLVASLMFVVYFEGEKSRALTGEWSMPSWASIAVWSSLLMTWVLEKIMGRFRVNDL